jgi:hypothetical protein
MALQRALVMSATAISVCLFSGQGVAAQDSDSRVSKLEEKLARLQKKVDSMGTNKQSEKTQPGLKKSKATPTELSVLSHMVRSGVTVSTTPFLGLRNGQVLYKVPSMNEDLRILKQRQDLEAKLNALGDSLNKRTLIGISGALEGDLIEQKNWQSKWAGDTNLGVAEIDLGVMAGKWIDGFFSITYNSTSVDAGSRVPSNQLYLQRGFLTFGNLDKLPFYFSIGQMYAPFGRYASAMITTPLTQSMGRISARTAVLGYSNGPLFVQVYGYNSQSQERSGFPADEGGVNFGGEYDFGAQSLSFGMGVVSNIADSQGALNNGNQSGFTGFNGSGASFSLHHSVPAVDAYANYTRGDWSFIIEGLGAERSYSPLDMYYQSSTSGAKPAALHTEVDYNTHFFGKSATAAIVYGQTWQAVAMNLPQHSVAVLYDVQVFRQAAIGVEFRHDINYKAGTAGGGATGTGSPASVSPVCEGGSRDILTARFGVYF